MELEQSLAPFLEPYLPHVKQSDIITPINEADLPSSELSSPACLNLPSDLSLPQNTRPFVTLTWAQSVDGRIAAVKGTQTKISGPETKVMTHYQRSRHDAILVGSGTALTDDPKLNCRYPETGAHMIRPVVVDPKAKWCYSKSTARKVYLEGAGIAPYIVVDSCANVLPEERDVLEKDEGKFISVPFSDSYEDNWKVVFGALLGAGIKSVMVEGGAFVIDSLLKLGLADSVVVTIGPVFLGREGTAVSPLSAVNLKDVKWWKGKHDAVLAGRPE